MLRLAALALTLLSGCATTASSIGESAPDYSLSDNWAARNNPSNKNADVFYVHPTTYRSDSWNQQMDDKAAINWTDLSVRDRQLDAFADCCALYMPYYRQASSRAFRERGATGDDAYAVAYADVLRAFRYFIARRDSDRPFIVAGHSQGALHGLRLLKEEIAGSDLQNLLVVAYLPGLGIPASALPEGIPACATAEETGCVASWNSFLAGSDPSEYIARSAKDYGVVGGDNRLVCNNPLTFDKSRHVGVFDDGSGARPSPPVAGPKPPLIKGKVSALCDGGVLMVSLKDGLPVQPLPGGSLHMNDISLFWGDIAANAARRVNSWSKD